MDDETRMSDNRPIFLCSLIVATCFGTWSFSAAPPPDDPVTFRGKRASYWRTLLKDEPWGIHFYYPEMSSPFWSTDADALPVLIRLAGDPNRRVRWSAIRLVGRYRERGGAATAVLTRALGDESDHIKIAALLAIAKVGPNASNARSGVEKLLTDPCREIVDLAKKTLQALQALQAE